MKEAYFLSLSLSHTHALSLSLSLSLTHTHSLTHRHTHTHTHMNTDRKKKKPNGHIWASQKEENDRQTSYENDRHFGNEPPLILLAKPHTLHPTPYTLHPYLPQSTDTGTQPTDQITARNEMFGAMSLPCRTSSYILCHIIIHTMSHHHTYYATSSYILCHIIIHTMPHHHIYYVTSSYTYRRSRDRDVARSTKGGRGQNRAS